MNCSEKRTIGYLATIIGLRMFGLFLMIPIISLYALSLPGSSPLLVGVALGIYGLTQACLQVPFGMLSDKFGRKPLIALGLTIFALGSLLAGIVHTIWGLLIGRALQGAGAISSVIMALAADVTTESERTKAVALIGMTIGMAFMLSFLCAPLLQGLIGVSGMFLLSAILSCLSLWVLYRFIPTTGTTQVSEATVQLKDVVRVVQNDQLWRLDASVALLHGILAMTFVALPILLHQRMGFDVAHQAWLYVPMLLASFVVMIPLLLLAEKYQRNKLIFLLAILLIAVAAIILWYWPGQLSTVLVALWLFFAGFNCLEATLPSWISKVAPKDKKGTALGVYSTTQFLGLFLGGLTAGLILQQHYPTESIFAIVLGLTLIWLLIVAGLHRSPNTLKSV